MKKILLLLVLVMTAGAVNAKTDKFACNQTISDSYSWTTSGYEICLFDNILDVDKSKYRKLHIKFSNKENISFMQVRVMCNGNYNTASWHKDYYSSSDITIDLTEQTYKDENATATDRTYSEISRIYLKAYSSDASKEASYNISKDDIYLETAEYETMEISTTLDNDATSSSPFQWYTSTDGTSKKESTSAFYKKQFNTADIKEIIAKAGSSLGWSNGFFDITGYDNATVNISTYKEGNDSDVRLLRATGANSTENIYISANKEGATTTSLSGLTPYWICGIYSRNANKSQAISSVVFTKQYKAYKADGAPAFNIAASSGSTVAYDRTFVSDRMSTVCLPFALTTSETGAAGKFYELIKVDDKGLHFTEVTETEAYKPYVFNPTAATPFASLTNKAIVATPASESDYAITVDGYTFQGVLAHQSLPSGVYGYNAANGVFSKTTSDKVTIDAFRAYITGPSLARSLNCIFSDDETTGIQTFNSVEKENGAIYNLAGQRVSANHKGIVIHNGKKVIVK